MKVTKHFCPQHILDVADIKNPPYNNYGGPIWMDFQPGSYIKKDGTECYSQNKKCEYVDKELIRNLWEIIKDSNNSPKKRDDACDAMEFFLNN